MSSQDYSKYTAAEISDIINNQVIDINRSQFRALLSNLEGKLLTIVDASYQDKEQREAIKSLVREHIWTWENTQIDKYAKNSTKEATKVV